MYEQRIDLLQLQLAEYEERFTKEKHMHDTMIQALKNGDLQDQSNIQSMKETHEETLNALRVEYEGRITELMKEKELLKQDL